MRKTILLAIFILPFYSFATVWLVGPGRTYSVPSQVANLVNNGDTVQIDPVTYVGDVCVWNSSNLLLKSTGGRAHLRANGNYAQGKGIWVFAGNNTRVENIEFSEAAVPDQNGAGIRLDGIGIQVKGCYFHNNEDGILTGNNGGNIIIEASEFAYNGFGDGQSHNIYIGRVDTAIIRFSYFHHAIVGHELKSRARVNYILYNRISNEASGNASREIDLPNGGMSFLIGNIIQQGAASLNGNIVGYGLEGLVNAAPHEIYLINNTLVNERSAGSFLSADAGTSLLKLYNNIFAGPGTTISYSGAAAIDSSGNKVLAGISAAGFVNASSYEYHLSSSSPAVNAGTAPGTGSNGFNLLPVFEYLHPASATARITEGGIDAGAYELNTVLALSILDFSAKAVTGKTIIQWQATDETNTLSYELQRSSNGISFESIGTIFPKHLNISSYAWEDAAATMQNFYRLKIIESNGAFYYSKTVTIRPVTSQQLPEARFAGRQLRLSNIPGSFKNKMAEIQIMNAAGQLLAKQKIMFTGSNIATVDFPSLSYPEKYLIIEVLVNQQRIAIPVASAIY